MRDRGSPWMGSTWEIAEQPASATCVGLHDVLADSVSTSPATLPAPSGNQGMKAIPLRSQYRPRSSHRGPQAYSGLHRDIGTICVLARCALGGRWNNAIGESCLRFAVEPAFRRGLQRDDGIRISVITSMGPSAVF